MLDNFVAIKDHRTVPEAYMEAAWAHHSDWVLERARSSRSECSDFFELAVVVYSDVFPRMIYMMYIIYSLIFTLMATCQKIKRLLFFFDSYFLRFRFSGWARRAAFTRCNTRSLSIACSELLSLSTSPPCRHVLLLIVGRKSQFCCRLYF